MNNYKSFPIQVIW